jgi:hypothetical protein
MNVLEAQIRSTLDAVSNGGGVEVKEEWIEQAGEEFKEALRRQFKPDNRGFRLRMSNIGRPLCQLQMEKSGAKQSRKPYNHVVRMLIGDAVESVIRLVLKAADMNVTSHGDHVSLSVAGAEVEGDSDLDIDERVFDIKSASPWAFKQKWRKGYSALKEDDPFGYIGQLYGYADAQGKAPGGWIVGDKSSGEILVVEVDGDESHAREVRRQREKTVSAIVNDDEFRRCFAPYEETYYGKPTGGKRLPMTCGFCSFLGACWPRAKLLPAPASKAKDPPVHWYVEHPEMEDGR